MMSSEFLAVTAAGLAGASVLVLGLSVAHHRAHEDVRRSVALAVSAGSPGVAVDVGPRQSTLAWVREGLDAVADVTVLPANRRWIRTQLARAGQVGPEHLQRAVRRKVLLAAGGVGLGAMAVLLWGVWGWIVLLVAAVTGYVTPDLMAYNAGLRRTEQIQRSLPDALDLLDLCVESGLSLQAAMGRVADSQSGPVAEEFARVLHEMRLGVPRRDALQALAGRATQNDLQQLVAAVLQAEALGIPIAAVLREQAREMRAKRSSRARESAQKVPVKIIAPLMVCFLPGLFIIILGPALVTVVGVLIGR